MHVGIDVSATRGYDVALLDDARRLVLLAKARDLDALAVFGRGIPPESVVAIDAPPMPSKGLVPGKRYRVAEEALHALGVSLYPTPPSEEDAATWMREGFATFELFAKMGFPVYLEGSARRGVSLEVYPHLTYRVLTGAARGRTSKIEWARAALRGKVTGIPKAATQDQLDAVAAALTAWLFARDRFVAHGDPREGVIIGPPEGPDLDAAAEHGTDQLALEIGSAASPAAAHAAAPKKTTFAERVLRLVATIPPGRVATYGDVARRCGNPTGGRAVGTLMARHAFEVPCHRVVDASGRPSEAYPGGPDVQLAKLAAEGVPVDGAKVALAASRWKGP